MARKTRMISSPPSVFFFCSWSSGKIGHDALAGLAVEDDLVGAAEDALHGLEEYALAGDVGRLLVFVVDLEEASRLALRLGDRLLLEAFGALQDALGFALASGITLLA